MTSSNGSTATDAPPDDAAGTRPERATVSRSAVRAVQGEQVAVDRSAIRSVRATQLTADRSAIGSASFEQGTLRQSTAGVVVARSVACDEVRTVILASPVVRGEVHTLVDLRAAVAIGFGMAIGKALIVGGRALARRVSR